MNDGASKSTAPTITARPTLEEKRWFAAVAAERHISESRLVLIAIRAWLESQSPDLLPHPSSSGPPWTGSRSVCGREIDLPSGTGRRIGA
ncbi:MAG: hypothetical protein ACLPWG_00985 [Steroidobacteraceae bacterium]